MIYITGNIPVKAGDWMEWKQEITIPNESEDNKPGRIVVYQLHDKLLLLLIDIRSYKIPEIIPEKSESETQKAFYINYCAEGRCELSMKDGSATYLKDGELAVDCGHTVHDDTSYYYPNKVYQGVELCFIPGEGLDKALSMGAENTGITSKFQKLYMEQDRLLITEPDNRVCTAFKIMEEDASLGMSKEVLLMDVYRLLTLLGDLRFAEAKRRTYYTNSQVKIAKLAMKELSENLSKRISAAELAIRYGISESSLKNYFRGVYGKGYHEYLNELRMKKAAEMLMQGGFKVSEIAAEVGYSNQSRFAQAFREHFGISPMEYSRRMHIEAESKMKED